jgi:hypothetical protein
LAQLDAQTNHPNFHGLRHRAKVIGGLEIAADARQIFQFRGTAKGHADRFVTYRRAVRRTESFKKKNRNTSIGCKSVNLPLRQVA